MQQKEFALYIFWGLVATVVNIAVFYFLSAIIGITYLLSNALAWIVSITIAFFSNKYFVFLDKKAKKGHIISEYIVFFMSRLLTGVLDMGLMFLLVTIFVIDEMYSKLVVGVLIIITNYIISKYFVFRK